MLSTQSLWWLALPVLLLPVWWHRQKRQRIKAEPLATARFLPAAPPQQLRVWRWEDVVLLALRCLLFAALIAWLAGVAMPWRGDTVLVDPALAAGAGAHGDAWTEQQIVAAGFEDAQRMPLPGNALPWLQAHELEWRPGARILIVAALVPMPAGFPRLAHVVDIRLRPAGAQQVANGEVVDHHVALATTPERAPAWRALFSAFDAAGDGKQRHVLDDAPAGNTELIVWDAQGTPPPSWRAPLWWVAPSFAAPELAAAKEITINGIALRIADSSRGRLWASNAWPPGDADAARALYETWQALSRPPAPYVAPALSLPARRTAPLAMPDAPPAAWLTYVLLLLFALERLLTHARRR